MDVHRNSLLKPYFSTLLSKQELLVLKIFLKADKSQLFVDNHAACRQKQQQTHISSTVGIDFLFANTYLVSFLSIGGQILLYTISFMSHIYTVVSDTFDCSWEGKVCFSFANGSWWCPNLFRSGSENTILLMVWSNFQLISFPRVCRNFHEIPTGQP